MRILIFNWRDRTHPLAGGAEVYVHEIGKRWVAWGHEVILVCGGYSGCKAAETIDGLRVLRRGGRFTLYPRAAFEYARRLRRECDVILDIENGIPFFSPCYARKPKVIVVHHIHRDQVFVEAGFPLNWIAYALETRCMPTAYRHCPFVTGTPSSRDGLIRLGVPSARITTIPYGLDHGWYRPRGEKALGPVILYLGRLKRYKRLDLLVRSMSRILQICPTASLWIAGRGDAREEIEGQVRDLGLSGQVTFWGFVGDREKVRLLERAWVLAYPSMAEGWGLSVLEANACGTPAVVFNVPGLRDAVIDGQTGFVVPDGNLEDLSERIGLILTDAPLRERLRERAIAWAQRFEWEDSARALLEVLEQVRLSSVEVRSHCVSK